MENGTPEPVSECEKLKAESDMDATPLAAVPDAPSVESAEGLTPTTNGEPKRYGQDPTRVDLLLWPHPALKTAATPVDVTSEDEKAHVVTMSKQMIDVAKSFNGVGLAANQVGGSRSFFVVKLTNGEWLTVVNPQITARCTNMKVWVEGCLSFPNKKQRTKRCETITATYLTLPDFAEVTAEFTGTESVCFQHEFDHLQGKTMRDRSFLGRVPPVLHAPGPFFGLGK